MVTSESEETLKVIRQRTHTGRPWGSEEFVHRLEDMLGRVLRPRKTGPTAKPKFNSWK